MIPTAAPTVTDVFIQESRATASGLSAADPVSSDVTSFAKPTQRWDVGLRSCAPYPMIPYVSRSSGYMSASASAPTGTAMSCM